jgi:hypothetical protein
MRVNQNFSQELDLYPKIDPTNLSSNSVKTTQLCTAIGSRNWLGSTKETRNGASKTMNEINDEN